MVVAAPLNGSTTVPHGRHAAAIHRGGISVGNAAKGATQTVWTWRAMRCLALPRGRVGHADVPVRRGRSGLHQTRMASRSKKVARTAGEQEGQSWVDVPALRMVAVRLDSHYRAAQDPAGGLDGKGEPLRDADQILGAQTGNPDRLSLSLMAVLPVMPRRQAVAGIGVGQVEPLCWVRREWRS